MPTLADTTMAQLRATFATRQHFPSDDRWDDISDVVATLQAMAEGSAADKVYLSSLDCGIGKSSAATSFARALIGSDDHRYIDGGMIICVNRTREADKMAMELADLGKHVVVLTADTAGMVTREDVGRAQLLITTQQRVDQALERDKDIWRLGRPFADLDQFYYHGQPRQVRVHDEAFLPGEAINLGRDLLGAMLAPARRLSVDFNAALDDFMDALKQAEQGSLSIFPTGRCMTA